MDSAPLKRLLERASRGRGAVRLVAHARAHNIGILLSGESSATLHVKLKRLAQHAAGQQPSSLCTTRQECRTVRHILCSDVLLSDELSQPDHTSHTSLTSQAQTWVCPSCRDTR
jgi:hypothetical protein